MGELKIVGICGSVRDGNYTKKALSLVGDEIGKTPGFGFELIDPGELELRMPGQKGGEQSSAKLQSLVSEAVAVVLATPEYHGSFSSVIKMAVENLGFPSKLAGKPVALLGVASGAIGAIKSLESLQGVCSHVGAIVLPGPVSISAVNKSFDASGQCTDERVEARVRKLAHGLIEYVRGSVCPRIALEAMVRESEA